MNTNQEVYLDYQATTPVDQRVLDAMDPWLRDQFGNAASRSHAFGWEAGKAVEEARTILANGIGGQSREITFTSGATESNNLALLGCARACKERGMHLISARTEHKSVLEPLEALQAEGFEITWLDVDREGHLKAAQLEAALRPDTTLVSLMHGNNEVGTLHPIHELGTICQQHGALFHCDATQTFGKETINVAEDGIDLLSASAHKMHGPKGVGILWMRSRPQVPFVPLLYGGGHERGIRPGTLNVPGIVGMGEAFQVTHENRQAEQNSIRNLRDSLLAKLQSIKGCTLNGSSSSRLAGNLNISFEHVDGEALLASLEGVAASTGSACTSAELAPSHVLLAMGAESATARGSIRFSLGRGNTAAEVEWVAKRTQEEVQRLRELSPLHKMAQETQ